jgi:hypothetical protein
MRATDALAALTYACCPFLTCIFTEVPLGSCGPTYACELEVKSCLRKMLS